MNLDSILRSHLPGKNNAGARKALREGYAANGIRGLSARADGIAFQRDLGRQIVDAAKAAGLRAEGAESA